MKLVLFSNKHILIFFFQRLPVFGMYPIQLFNITGVFNITLTVVDNDSDSDTLERIDFIHVLDPLQDDDGDGFFNRKEMMVGTDPLSEIDIPQAGNTPRISGKGACRDVPGYDG